MASGEQRSADENVPVLIVGAGPAGLTTALALARQGVQCQIITRHPNQAHTPRAHITNQRTMEIFRALGVADDVVEKAVRIEDIPYNPFILSMAGPEVVRATAWGAGLKDQERYRRASPYTPYNIHQHRLEPVLADAVVASGLADLRYDTEFLDFTEHPDGVDVRTRHRGTGELRTVRARYLVGADGAHSAVREQAGLSLTGEMDLATFGFVWVKADLRRYAEYRPAAMYWSIDMTEFPTWIMLNRWDEWMISWQIDPDTFDLTDHDAIREVLHRSIGDRSVPIEIVDVTRWKVNHAVAEQYSSGRVFCAGDAVHVHPPFNGLGSNTAVADGFNLAWKLAAVLSGRAGPRLLDTYSQERAPVGRQVIDRAYQSAGEVMTVSGAFGVTPEMSTDTKWQKIIEADAPGPEGESRRASIAEAMELMEYNLNAHGVEIGYRYETGALVRDSSDPAGEPPSTDLVYRASTVPGEHLPHVWLERGRRQWSTLDLIGDGFALITGRGGEAWTDAAEQVRQRLGVGVAVRTIGALGSFRDLLGEWAAVRGTDEDGAVLLRPDGHVAWRARSAESAGELVRVMATLLDRRLPAVVEPGTFASLVNAAG
ncbi:FAD-dependent monooxygenase [Streptomyces sp. NPDC002588]|uniref:FAD-dependent monooxygenase n=1 Tax=Streptomyces sp. NPDC002588 TaxID=3154419 RepID=UPI003323F589